MLVPGRYVFVYGVFYPQQGDHRFEAAQVVFAGRRAHEFVFEKPDWWVQQIWQMGDFYYRAQFGTGEPDWRTYRVNINMAGQKVGNRQETDTMSRLIYGLSTAYHMTGEDRFLEAAEAGVEYLRDHLRHTIRARGSVLVSRDRHRRTEREEDPRLGVRRRLRRHPGVRTDLRPRGRSTGVPDHARSADQGRTSTRR